jgi:hypothetical protein
MLYLGNGIRTLALGEQNMLLFPDFSDPEQFYVLPNNPHVAKLDDGSPAIGLHVFFPDLSTVPDDKSDAVAFLSLDVDLSWPAESIEQAASRLQVLDNLPRKPRLTPIFFRSGKVKLMLLDAVTPEPGETETETPTRFVTKILGSSSPSLFGDNRAIFQAMLDREGAQVLMGALDGIMPIGVVYTLTFAGLAPSYNVRARVDWHKVYDHFSEQEQMNFLFYESDIQKSIDKLVEERSIVIESTLEGVGEEAMTGDYEAVMTSVRKMIFDQFFEATFKRVDPAGGSVLEEVGDTLRSTVQDAITFGIGYTYRRKEVKIDELRVLDLDWTVRRGVERTIYPQAHMHSILSAGGVTQSSMVKLIEGTDQLWSILPFDVSAAAAWEADGIDSVIVECEYDDAVAGMPRGFVANLTKDTSRVQKRDWLRHTEGRQLRYRYEVVFSDGTLRGPPKLTTGDNWLEHTGTALVVHPRELFEVVELGAEIIPTFPFDRWPAVQVMMRSRALDGSYAYSDDGTLNKNTPAFKLRYRTTPGISELREVRLTWFGADGRRVDGPWELLEGDTRIVEDPHAPTLTVRAVVAGDRASIANLLVDLEYEDSGADIFTSSTFAFDAENIAKPQTWTVHLADPSRRRYRYRMTLVTKSGDFVQTGWIGTDSPTLPVGEAYVRTLSVDLETAELGADVDAIEVTLAYEELDARKTFVLGSRAEARWELKLADASRRSYTYSICWRMTDGFDVRTPFSSSSATFLAIPGEPPKDD